MAWAQRVWDYLDHKMLDSEYNLPTPSPRKNQKRVENCKTFCALNAAAHVFFFKQVLHSFCSQKPFLLLTPVLFCRPRCTPLRVVSTRTASLGLSRWRCCGSVFL